MFYFIYYFLLKNNGTSIICISLKNSQYMLKIFYFSSRRLTALIAVLLDKGGSRTGRSPGVWDFGGDKFTADNYIIATGHWGVPGVCEHRVSLVLLQGRQMVAFLISLRSRGCPRKNEFCQDRNKTHSDRTQLSSLGGHQVLISKVLVSGLDECCAITDVPRFLSWTCRIYRCRHYLSSSVTFIRSRWRLKGT